MTEQQDPKSSNRRRAKASVIPNAAALVHLDTTQDSEALAVHSAAPIVTKDTTIAAASAAAAAGVDAAREKVDLARSSVADIATAIDQRVETDGKALGEKIANVKNNTVLTALAYASEVQSDPHFRDLSASVIELYRG